MPLARGRKLRTCPSGDLHNGSFASGIGADEPAIAAAAGAASDTRGMDGGAWTIRPLSPNDPALDAVLAHVDAEHRLLDRWVHEADVVYSASVDDCVVAFGARSHFPLHPARDWITVHVEPTRRRCGIGSALLHELRRGAGIPSKVRIPTDQRAGLSFAHGHGYSEVVTSGEIVLRDMPEPSPLSDADIVAASTDDAGFLDALGQLYVASHRWDPCAGLERADVRRLLAGDDVVPGSARVVWRGGEIVGVGLAYLGPSGDFVEMANFGAVDPETSDAIQITHAVLDAVGRGFLDRGLSIAIECDYGAGANMALQDLLERFGIRPGSTVQILATSKA